MVSRLASAAALLSAVSFAAPSVRSVTASISVNAASRYQEVDGFGCSEAFQRAEDVLGKYGLSPENQDYLLDLMFSEERGAGFTILRNGIGSSSSSASNFMNSIEPDSPGSPTAPPHYVWDHYNSGQFPLSQKARARGLPFIYADAWSAPGFMKTNDNNDFGGYLCGVTNETCESGDWKQAYADYLVQYWKFYIESGVKVTHIGFLNEPQLNTSYASMQSDGTQAADFIRVLGRTVEREGIDVKLTCCDGVGWKEQEAMMAGLQAKGEDGRSAEDYLSVITGHGYSSAPDFPLSTELKTWETEWADLSGEAWDPYTFYQDGSAGEGMTWANRIQTAFVDAHVSAFLYWIGAENSTTNSALINLLGNEVVPSKRFWAFASFSKFVRPGAIRIDATSSNSELTVSAFENTNGVVSMQVISSAATDTEIEVSFAEAHGHPHWINRWGGGPATTVVPYLTDNENDLAPQKAISVGRDGKFKAIVPAKSLVNFVV